MLLKSLVYNPKKHKKNCLNYYNYAHNTSITRVFGVKKMAGIGSDFH